MLELLYQGILTSILTSDTATTVALLEEHKSVFLDPIEGVNLHAQVLYCAMKHTNLEVIRYLLNLLIPSDVAFFKFCGHTPISMAVEEGRNELLPFLIARTDKNFALHMAVKLNLKKTINFLLGKCVFKQKLLSFLGIRNVALMPD